MNISSVTPDEQRRLEALRRYGVLDTPPEDALDELTALAAAICETPIALISLVDERRQWFKSKVGLEANETPLEVSFCRHALKQPDLFIVPDATMDSRFMENPLVTGEPGIRFYAGAPLFTPEHEALGTLCVIDRIPRTLTPLQTQALRVLSRQVMAQIGLLHRHTIELTESEERLRIVTETTRVGLVVVSRDRRYLYANPAYAEILGLPLSEIVGRHVPEVLAEKYEHGIRFLMDRAFAGDRITFEMPWPAPAGNRHLDVTYEPRIVDGVAEQIVAVIRDITERRQADEALRESETRFAKAFRFNPAPMSISTIGDGRFIEVNDRYCQLFGFTREEFIGRTSKELRLWADSAERDALVSGLPAGGFIRERETRFRRKDGEPIDALISMEPIELSGEREPVMIAMFTDITERKRVEEARRVSDARYRTLFDNAPDGILIGDPEGYYLDANASMCRMLGYTQSELVGMHVSDIIAPAETKGIEPVLNEIRGGSEHHREWTFRRKDGALFPVEVIATQMPDGNLLGMVRDISERKSLEQQFLRAQRLESIGTLASGVAHDLNNILAPIMMSVPVLRMEMSAADREGIITTIEMSAERGAQIVKQVLTFGRGFTGEKRSLQIGVLIREMVKIMRETFPKNIAVEPAVAPDLWRVFGDATQIHQVLLNLCVNARDAMPDGGRLRLSARNLEVDASYASMVPEARPGPHVFIEVGDTGTGIPPEIIERIFDPFFTTKGVGEGTGLGLSTVHGIVRSHGGFIHVESSPGKGTAFRVHLPAVTATDDAPAAASPAGPPRGHGELVLVVDDEEAIAKSAQTVLEMHGYRVLLAADGTDALAIFAQNSGGVAAVLTDLMMPVMDGMALIRALRKMQPGLPVIASTGLDDKIRAADLKSLRVQTVLKKPYAADALLRTIHEALHPPPESARSVP